MTRRTRTNRPDDAADRRAMALRREALETTIALYERPQTRQDCLPGGCNGERPCPWASCRHHLFVDVTRAGGLRLTAPGVELEDFEGPTCALDLAEEGWHTLSEIGAAIATTRERVRKVEAQALAAFGLAADEEDVVEDLLELAAEVGDHRSARADADDLRCQGEFVLGDVHEFMRAVSEATARILPPYDRGRLRIGRMEGT